MAGLPPLWLRGPVAGIQPALQPVAHALLQVAEETPEILAGVAAEQIWAQPGGSASIGFHIVHLSGSLDRLFTYARGEGLSPEQFDALAAERTLQDRQPPLSEVLALLARTVDHALAQLKQTEPASLYLPREVGRAKLPSNTLGLLFHAAEHTIRHGGQIITLLRIVRPTA